MPQSAITLPITNLVLWQNSSIGVIKDRENRVTAWADQAGLHNDAAQTSLAAAPRWVAAVSHDVPGISFDGVDDRMLFASSATVNSGGPYSQKTLALVFKTGRSVRGNQVLWQQGDIVRGLNVYISYGGRFSSSKKASCSSWSRGWITRAGSSSGAFSRSSLNVAAITCARPDTC